MCDYVPDSKSHEAILSEKNKRITYLEEIERLNDLIIDGYLRKLVVLEAEIKRLRQYAGEFAWIEEQGK